MLEGFEPPPISDALRRQLLRETARRWERLAEIYRAVGHAAGAERLELNVTLLRRRAER